MSGTFNNASFFLIDTLFDAYIFILLVRIILAFVRADYFNPMTQFFIKLTQPIVGPLRRMLPNYKNFELSSVFLVLVLEAIKFILLAMLIKNFPNLGGILILSVADALRSLLNIFFYAILLQAIMSWLQQGYSPAGELLNRITMPIMRPFQRLIPTIGGIDITPIPVMIILRLLIIVLVSPLFAIGQVMAFS
jgi:YggT family protein